MFSAPQPEAPVFAPIPGHAPMETREALAPLPLEAVQGNQALKNANAKPLPPLPLNGTPGKTAVEQVAQTPGLPGGRPAPFLYRAGAWLFDVIIFALFATVIGTGNVAENGGPGGGVSLAGVLKLLALLVFSLLYYVLLESSATQGTLGKKACGLVVTDMQGRRISLGRATGRFFARLLCWPLTLGIGYVIAAFTKQRQGLHDMVAGCLVRRGAPESAGLPTGEMKKERTPAILIILGLGVTAAACMVGYTYFISHSEVSLPASEPSVTAAPASAPGATPAPVAAPPAGTNSAAIPNTGTGTGAGMPMPPATGATVWKKGLPMADVQALAARGDVQAQMELAFACAAGRGVPKSLTTAAEWMRKAADTGDGFAQYHMGYAYRMGEGVPKDDAEAARWYRKAAEQGVALAQVDLACAYFAGEGVAKDDAASVMWMRKAAEQNNREALDSLGSAYQYGVGVTKDLEEAVKWYRKAAALNYPLGLFHLGACYEDGQGVTRDLAEALKWYILTDANGDQGIIDARNELEGRMSLEDRAEAVRRAKEEAERLEKK
ncbi:RDD family protein [Prosthecobacter sp.]|uniref:RDD family protein n=1 Tax=Prosthecobacter sp. TaxID=1965333 RepID=UPI003784E20E